jgi:DDE superfamily endonuclease/Helix-turn-helix of DDE superfamily endonuclease
MLTFIRLSKKPSQVRAFTGLTPAEFQEFAGIYHQPWEAHRLASRKAERTRAVGGGRRLKLAGFDERLLCFLVYAKLYCTYDLLGYLFDCDAATACRTVADVRSVVGVKLLVNRAGRRIRTIDELLQVHPELEEVLLDVTEQKIPRPKNKKKRKAHHSGKKQAFTLMTQVLTSKDSFVLHVSPPTAGRRHDVTLFKKSAVPKWLAKHKDRIQCRADGGYEGMDRQYPDIRIVTPVKRQRNKPELTKQEIRGNKRHSSKRIPVEHSFAGVKQFQLLGQIYRGKEQDYKRYFVAIASVRNFRMLVRAEQPAT